MPEPAGGELSQRIEQVADRLSSAVAFSRLLAGNQEDEDEEIGQLASETKSILDEFEKSRPSFRVFAGSKARLQVCEFEDGCARLLEKLADRDETLSPSTIRQYLQHRQIVEGPELIDLLKFYLCLERGTTWSSQHIDKVDLLITQLGQRLGWSTTEQPSRRLNLLLEGHRPSTPTALEEIELQNFRKNLEIIRSEVEAADSLGHLIDSGILRRYRRLKHRLGHLLVNPDLLAEIITTNLELQKKVRRLNTRVVSGIFSTYQGIFDLGLKGKIDPLLRAELDQLHLDFNQFEICFQKGELRLTELERFWRTLKTLATRLDQSIAQELEAPEPPRRTLGTAGEPDEAWLEEDLLVLIDSLREHDRKGWPPEHITFPPQRGFQLDRREIVAFRRLAERDGADRSLELFLLKAAALRRSIKRSARNLAKLADSETLREVPVFEIAQQAVQLAETFLARYQQAVQQAIVEGDALEAQRLQILRMRLVRESSGIWLQIHQPD